MVAAAPSVHAQGDANPASGRTVWNGVYTEAQASRGEARYQETCSLCHKGGPRKDAEFMQDWSGSDVESLFTQIKESMPANAPSSLDDKAYLDIVAYMLRQNAFPSGGGELTAAAIKNIRIEGPHGPEPVPDFALVRTVGCLSRASDAAWMLSDASEPVRTKEPSASRGQELSAAKGTASGVQRFQLLNAYPKPDKYEGQRVEAKGFLMRDAGGNRINVTSVQSLSSQCER